MDIIPVICQELGQCYVGGGQVGGPKCYVGVGRWVGLGQCYVGGGQVGGGRSVLCGGVGRWVGVGQCYVIKLDTRI